MHQPSFYQSGKLSKYPTVNMCTALSVRNCMMTWYLILSWQSAILLHAWKVKKWLLSTRLWLTCVLRWTDPDKWTTWPSPDQHRMEKSLHPATMSTDALAGAKYSDQQAAITALDIFQTCVASILKKIKRESKSWQKWFTETRQSLVCNRNWSDARPSEQPLADTLHPSLSKTHTHPLSV